MHTSAPGRVARCAVNIMFENTRKSLVAPVAVIAAFAMLFAGVVLFAEGSQAQGEDLSGTYGEPYTIEVAPGFSWTYTASFNLEGTVLSFAVNDLGDNATFSGMDVTVNIPEQTGTYNLVLQGYHEASKQYTYQYIQFDVKDGIVITPESTILTDTAIVGESVNYVINATAGYGSINSIEATFSCEDDVSTEGVFTATPTIGADGNYITITGAPTEGMAGKTVSINVSVATDKGETATKTYTFEVYSDFALSATNETIGNYADSTSTVISFPADVTVSEWTGVSDLTAGIAWDEGSRTLSVTSDAYIDEDIVIGATTADGQSASITIHVDNENTAADIAPNQASIVTAVDLGTKTVTFAPTLSDNFSGIKANSYALASAVNGFSIDASTGVVTLDPAVSGAVESGTVTVNAETNFGMPVSAEFTYTVEGDLTFTATDDEKALILVCDDVHTVESAAFNGAAQYATVTYSYEVTSGNEAGLTSVSVENGKLVVDGSTPASTFTIVVTAHTAGGQSESVTYTVTSWADLSFTSELENGALAFEA